MEGGKDGRRNERRKETAKRRKGCAAAEMNNGQLACAEHCYLRWQSQKSSPPSTAITTSPLSPGATGRATTVTKEIVRAWAKRGGEEKEGRGSGRVREE